MRSLALAATLLTLGACSSLPEPQVHPAPAPPLRAYITPPSVGAPLGFHTSRPAYVALFDVVPGQGVSLLYPGFGTGSLDGRAFGGYTSLASARPMNLEQYRYAGYPGAAAGAWTQPHFFFLIASERPLNVERFGSWGSRLWTVLGNQFYSANPYGTMEELTRLAVPQVADDRSWTSDVYVYWPNVLAMEPGLRSSGRRYVLLSCGNGYSFYVDATMLAVAKAMICDRVDERTPRDSASTGRPVKPGTREPLPKKIAESLADGPAKPERRPVKPERIREKITASAQLDEPAEPATPAERARLRRWGGVVASAPGPRGTPVARDDGSARPPQVEGGRVTPSSPRAEPARRTTPTSTSSPKVERSTPRAEPSRPTPSPAPAPRARPTPVGTSNEDGGGR